MLEPSEFVAPLPVHRTAISDGQVGTGKNSYYVPPLVDGTGGIGGYRESRFDPILRAPRAILGLMAEFGVGAVRITESSWADYWHMQALDQDEGPFPVLLGAGPVLVDAEPTSDRQRWIRSSKALSSALDMASSERSSWVGLKTESGDFAASAVREAHARGLRIALRGPVKIGRELRSGDIFCGLVNLLRQSLCDRPAKILGDWAGQRQVAARQAVDHLFEQGVLLTTELISTHRIIFVRNSLAAPFLEENVPILPHVRHLLQMRGAVGYFGGRGALRDHAGLVEPSRHEADLASDGWQQLKNFAGDVCKGGEFMFVGSGAPQLTVVPGYGLREEMALLSEVGVPLETVLSCSTQLHCSDHQGTWLNQPQLVTEVSPTDAARFIMSLRPQKSTDAKARPNSAEAWPRGLVNS